MSHVHPLVTQNTLSVADLLAYPHIKVIGSGDKDSYVDKALAKLEKQRRFTLKVLFFYATAQSLAKANIFW